MNVRLAVAALGALVLALALAGCVRGSTPKAPVTAPPILATPAVPAMPAAPAMAAEEEHDVIRDARPRPDEAERLLAYFERLKRLQGAELAREHESARQAYARTASEFNRIGYAMTLSLPAAPFNDDTRALELLQPVVRNNRNGLRALGVLLTTFIQERRRLGVNLAAAQQKLDALRSLERRLIERDQSNAPRK